MSVRKKHAGTSGGNIGWTTAEIRILRDNADEGAVGVARLLGRSTSSVEHAAYRHRVSLRRPGHRCGSVLGQPRGVRLRAAMRADIVDGRVSATLIAARMKIDHDAALCPCCGYREIEVKNSGLCRPCHVSRLIQGHKDALAAIEAQRRLWSVRQELHRARVASTVAPLASTE